MKKVEIAGALAIEYGMSQVQADKVLESVLSNIRQGLKSDGEVVFRGFGTFKVKQRGAKIGRNPKTGEEVKIPPRKAVTFTPGGDLKAYVA